MEYVQKAIEKAREERQGNVGEQAGASQVEKASSASSLADKAALSINYTQTRQVELSNKVLMDKRIVAAFEDDQRAEPYRQLRTQVLQTLRENNWRTLAITSAQQNAGKTLTAVNLAIALSKEVNQTVLLVDLDFKQPDVLDSLGISVDAGLVEYLNGQVELQDILVNPGFNRLSIMPVLPVAGPTSEILSSPQMKSTLSEIVNRYEDRLVIFDLPPLLRDDDALVFTPYVDATLLVVEDGVTTPQEIDRCTQLLNGTSLLGTVLNKAD